MALNPYHNNMRVCQGHQNKSAGFIKAIIVIVIALVVLGYFGFNVAEIVKKPIVKNNLEFAYNGAKLVWTNYLAGPASGLWDHMMASVQANNK